MASRWKHVFSGFLLCIFSYTCCLSDLLVNARLLIHRSNVQSLLSTIDSPAEIAIDAALVETANATFQWKGENEFLYYGRMYDVSDARKVNDTWIFTCENDFLEEILTCLLETSEEEQDEQSGSGKKNDKNAQYDLQALHEFPSGFSSGTVASGNSTSQFEEPLRLLNDPPPWLS